MGRKIAIPHDEIEATAASPLAVKFPLSPTVQRVSPKVLIPNPRNAQYFTTNVEDLKRLKDDIAVRGILTPLMAKNNGELLSGHSRLQIALELGLESVPVLYAMRSLTESEEIDFLITDNLLRRHLTGAERIELYKIKYPDFEQTFLSEETRVTIGRRKSGEERTTIAKIAGETGQKISTVKTQIQAERERRLSLKGNGRGPSISNNAKKNVNEAKKLVGKLNNIMKSLPSEEQKEIRALVKSLL
jgi:hypothetical protein